MYVLKYFEIELYCHLSKANLCDAIIINAEKEYVTDLLLELFCDDEIQPISEGRCLWILIACSNKRQHYKIIKYTKDFSSTKTLLCLDQNICHLSLQNRNVCMETSQFLQLLCCWADDRFQVTDDVNDLGHRMFSSWSSPFY